MLSESASTSELSSSGEDHLPPAGKKVGGVEPFFEGDLSKGSPRLRQKRHAPSQQQRSSADATYYGESSADATYYGVSNSRTAAQLYSGPRDYGSTQAQRREGPKLANENPSSQPFVTEPFLANEQRPPASVAKSSALKTNPKSADRTDVRKPKSSEKSADYAQINNFSREVREVNQESTRVQETRDSTEQNVSTSFRDDSYLQLLQDYGGYIALNPFCP